MFLYKNARKFLRNAVNWILDIRLEPIRSAGRKNYLKSQKYFPIFAKKNSLCDVLRASKKQFYTYQPAKHLVLAKETIRAQITRQY